MTTATYPEQLRLFAKKQALESLTHLKDILETKGWTKARDLLALLNLPDDRCIRHLAEISRGEIIGTNKGYNLNWKSSDEDFEDWKRRQVSQAKKTTERVKDAELVRLQRRVK